MIESVFGVMHSAIEYSVKLDEFRLMIDYILKEKFGVKFNSFSLRVDSINHVTVLTFEDKYKDEISLKTTGKKYSYSNERNIKKRLLKELFDSDNVSEKIIYNNIAQHKAIGVQFKVEKSEFGSQKAKVRIRNSAIDMINAQINVLNEKKKQIIMS